MKVSGWRGYVGVVLACAVGFVLGRQTSPQPSEKALPEQINSSPVDDVSGSKEREISKQSVESAVQTSLISDADPLSHYLDVRAERDRMDEAAKEAEAKFTRMLEEMVNRDARAALTFLEDYQDKDFWEGSFLFAFCVYADHHPADAAEYLYSVTNEAARVTAGYELAKMWAELDINSAFAWMNEKLDEGDYTLGADAYLAIMSEYTKQYPDKAMDVVAQMEPSVFQMYLVNGMANRIPLEKLEEALKWTDQITSVNKAAGYYATETVMRKWAEASPVEALNYVVNHPSWSESDITSYIYYVAAGQKPEAAVGLIDTLPERYRTEAAGDLALQWLAKDADAAQTWMASLPPGEQRDRAVHSMALHYIDKNLGDSSDPYITNNYNPQALKSTLDWATTIQDSKTRGEILVQMAQQWGRLDHTAAKAAIETADLRAADRIRIEIELQRTDPAFNRLPSVDVPND